MKLLRAATLCVEDIDRSSEIYSKWLDYKEIERGALSEALCVSWGCPASKGARYCVMEPASGTDIYVRFIEQTPVDGYLPLRTYGWNAIEICVQDVLAVDARLKEPGSPFEIIGPPKEIEGLDAIFPMQVKGPDNEIVYFTQIRNDLPAYNLPRAGAPIDKLFILVLGCSDLKASMKWFEDAVRLQSGREMNIIYTMLAKAYGTPEDELHTIATMIDEKDVFLELDQYPLEATPRPSHHGMLPPGVALATFKTPHFDKMSNWLTLPEKREGAIYAGGRAGTMKGPDGTLVELVEII